MTKIADAVGSMLLLSPLLEMSLFPSAERIFPPGNVEMALWGWKNKLKLLYVTG